MARLSQAWENLQFHDILTAHFLDENQAWRKITYKGFSYFVSDHGNVYSMVKSKYLISNVRKVHTQYYGQYSFAGQWFSAHRLVLLAFGPEYPGKDFEVNHKDGNGRNNHISNLEWVTHRQNIQHSFRPEGRKRISGAEHWNYGKQMSEESRRKMSEKKKAYWKNR